MDELVRGTHEEVGSGPVQQVRTKSIVLVVATARCTRNRLVVSHRIIGVAVQTNIWPHVVADIQAATCVQICRLIAQGGVINGSLDEGLYPERPIGVPVAGESEGR